MELKDYIWIVLALVMFGAGFAMGHDIGNDEVRTVTETKITYINQTDNCLEEVIDTLDDADIIRKRVMNYGGK